MHPRGCAQCGGSWGGHLAICGGQTGRRSTCPDTQKMNRIRPEERWGGGQCSRQLAQAGKGRGLERAWGFWRRQEGGGDEHLETWQSRSGAAQGLLFPGQRGGPLQASSALAHGSPGRNLLLFYLHWLFLSFFSLLFSGPEAQRNLQPATICRHQG